MPVPSQEARVKFRDHILLYLTSKEYGVPNFIGAQVPIFSNFKIDFLRASAQTSWETEIVDMIEYGFPSNSHYNFVHDVHMGEIT